jgi:hypothetical protein
MNSTITDFISAAVAEKPKEALSAFTDALEPKLFAALDNKRTEVVSNVFNSGDNEDVE